MLETITGNHMAIKELTKQDLLGMNSMTKSFSSELWKLKNKHEENTEKTDLISSLFNLHDILSLKSFDYYMLVGASVKHVTSVLDLIFKDDSNKDNADLLKAEAELKDDIITYISSVMSINNKKFRDSSSEEKKQAAAAYTEHFKIYVFNLEVSKNRFAYKNEYDKSSKLISSKRTATDNLLKKDRRLSIETNSNFGTTVDDQKISFLIDDFQTLSNGTSKWITTTTSDSYIGFYSKEEHYGIDGKFYFKDGVLHIKSGKVKLGAGVEIVEASGEVKAEPTPVAPVAAKPAKIEQPKPVAKPKPAPAATPVAQAKPTPATAPVAKPEPAVTEAEAFLDTVAVDADEDEQAMLDELPDDL